MKIQLILIFLLSSLTLSAQEMPNNFRIGDYLEIYSNDSVLIFYNKNGAICSRKCADLFRIARLDKSSCNVNDTVRDYYIDGTLQFEGLMKNNSLNGPAVYYYPDGVTKQMGMYENDQRKGFWKYYYPGGTLEKEFYFVNGMPTVVTLLTPYGDTLVNDGNGSYTGVVAMDATENNFTVSGQIKNYLMDGEWTLAIPEGIAFTQSPDGSMVPDRSRIICTEQFREGKMLKGNDGRRNYKDQKILLHGYVLNEYLGIIENTTLCLGTELAAPPRNSLDKNVMGDTFYPHFLDEMKKIISSGTRDQWLLISVNIGKENDLRKVIVYSSSDDMVLEKQVQSLILSKFGSWRSKTIQGKPVESDLLFTLVTRNNQVMIPANGSWKKV